MYFAAWPSIPELSDFPWAILSIFDLTYSLMMYIFK